MHTHTHTHAHQILDGEGNPVVLAHLVQMFLQLRNTNIFCVNIIKPGTERGEKKSAGQDVGANQYRARETERKSNKYR
jgi:hypothetical protein